MISGLLAIRGNHVGLEHAARRQAQEDIGAVDHLCNVRIRIAWRSDPCRVHQRSRP
jgi:hypothetical protein